MKTSIVIVTIFGLLAAGCSTTTYMNLKENEREQIEDKINMYEKDENVGAELTFSLMNGTEINGELLSVGDSSMTLSTKYAIITVKNNEIKELTIEGSRYIWSGMGYGALGGALLGAVSIYTIDQNKDRPKLKEGAAIIIGGVLGALIGAIAGGVVGYVLSTEEYVIKEIPPNYNWSILKPLSRYPDEEPKYQKAIK